MMRNLYSIIMITFLFDIGWHSEAYWLEIGGIQTLGADSHWKSSNIHGILSKLQTFISGNWQGELIYKTNKHTMWWGVVGVWYLYCYLMITVYFLFSDREPSMSMILGHPPILSKPWRTSTGATLWACHVWREMNTAW